MEKKQFTGKNIEEALEKAQESFAIEKSLISYSILKKPPAGLFAKMFNRAVTIEAWIETTKQDLQAAARAAVQQALFPPSTAKGEFEKYSHMFFSAFDIPASQVTVSYEEDQIRVRVQDDFLESLLSKSDKLSSSFDHIYKRITQKKCDEPFVRLVLEAGVSSSKHEEQLVSIAQKLAEKVKKTGKSVVLASKSSQERKIIHMTLGEMPGIATRSIGVGERRKLMIYSTAEKRNNVQKSKAPPKQRTREQKRE